MLSIFPVAGVGGWKLDKSSVCANENEPQNVNGPVVVRLTTTRFTGTVSTENRSSLAAYPRTQYVPPWDSVPHPENCTFSGFGTESQGGTYWVRRYAARELRFSVLTVPVKREVVSLTTTGPLTVCGSFSFAQTELCLAQR